MAAHLATDKHRRAGYAAHRAPDTVGAEDRQAWAAARARASRAAEDDALEAEAMRGGPDREPYWLAVAIASGVARPEDPGDGTWYERPFEIEISGEHRTVAAVQLDACPRCGRLDWRTAAGRAAHVDGAPDCLRFRRPDKHRYADIAA
jgi:hypothetical protein